MQKGFFFVPVTFQVKVDKLDKEIEKINWNTDMMTKKIEDMTSSGGVMERSITTTSKTIGAFKFIF